MLVIEDIGELSDRAILLRIHANTITLGVQLSAISDAVAATQTALDQLKVDIAAEIQQVAALLTASADIPAAVDQLNAITAQLQSASTDLRADDTPV